MAYLDTYFGNFGCGQIQAEAKHDKLPKWATYFEAIDHYQNYCTDHAQTAHPDFNDKSFVQYIFNRSHSDSAKEELKAAGLTSSHYIQYKGIAHSHNTFDYCDGNIYTFKKVTNNYNQMQKFINTFHGIDDAYLFIDTGHSLISAMNDQMHPADLGTYGGHPRLHVINSQVSMGDSCTTGKSIYNENFYYNNLYCWWYRSNITIPPYGDPLNMMFFTSLTCEFLDEGEQYPSDTNIRQNWYEGSTFLTTIYQTMSYNNISQVSKDINNAWTVPEQALCYQRKRSGDGYQIWFMNHFARLIANGGENMFFATCYNGGAEYKNDSEESLGDITEVQGQSKEDIRAKSFFVTIDWPAFCWAAYCHNNVIFYNAGDVVLFFADPGYFDVHA